MNGNQGNPAASETFQDVSCLVLLDSEAAFLATQRPPNKALGGLWEFPGGKVEVGESPEAALRRELWEELRLEIGAIHPLSPVKHRYPFGTIRLLPFLARCDTRPAFSLLEHASARWITPKEAGFLAWAPADMPIVTEVLALLSRADPKFAPRRTKS